METLEWNQSQTVSPTFPSFQGLRSCIKYLVFYLNKPIFIPSNYFDVSNSIRITWIENQVEDYTTQICLEYHQCAYHDRIINRRRLVSGIIHILLGVEFFCKVQIQLAIAFEYTDGEIRYIHKAINKNKETQ